MARTALEGKTLEYFLDNHLKDIDRKGTNSRIKIIKNVSSSTSHKKTPSLRLSVLTSLRLYENLWAMQTFP